MAFQFQIFMILPIDNTYVMQILQSIHHNTTV